MALARASTCPYLPKLSDHRSVGLGFGGNDDATSGNDDFVGSEPEVGRD